ARKGQENGTSATPNISVTTGDITSPTSTVSTAQDTSEAMNRGHGRPCSPRGHASMMSMASPAERPTTRSSGTPGKPSHGGVDGDRPGRAGVAGGGGGRVDWGGGGRGAGGEKVSQNASAIPPPAANAISPRCRTKPPAKPLPPVTAPPLWLLPA